jgi:Na+-transporting NADH:ubiquinone oxidoreductase subunit NqrA
MYHLLIEQVSTVSIEFLQYQAQVRIGLNRADIERVVERTGLFTSLKERVSLIITKRG